MLSLATLLAAVACAPRSTPIAEKPAVDKTTGASSGDPQAGRTLLIAKGCGACHTARGVPEASGTIGPTLNGVGSKAMIAETIPNTPENMKRWITSPNTIKPGTMMPPLGLSDKEADDLVAFLETLK
jgi:cytochrome c2